MTVGRQRKEMLTSQESTTDSIYPLHPSRHEEFKQSLYKQHPSFGNYSQSEKRSAIIGMYGGPQPELDPKIRETSADWVLKQIGEEQTYSVGEAAADVGGPLMGGIEGAKIGGIIGGAPGAFIGSMLGATIMGGGVEAGKEWYERNKRDIPQDTQAIIEAGWETMKWQALAELIAPIVSKIGLKTFAKVLGTREVSDAARISQDVLARLPTQKTHFGAPAMHSVTLGQTAPGKGRFVQWLEGVATGGFLSSDIINRTYEANAKGVRKLFHNLMGKAAREMDPVQFTHVTNEMLSKNLSATKALRNRYYDDAYAMIEQIDAPVPLQQFRAWALDAVGKRNIPQAKKLVQAVRDHLGITPRQVAPGTVAEMSDKEIMDFINKELPRSVPAWQAGRLIHAINREYDKLGGTAVYAKKAIEDPFMAVVRESSPDAAKHWEFARGFFKESVEELDNDLVNSMLLQASDSPDKIATLLSQPGTRLRNYKALERAFDYLRKHPEIYTETGKQVFEAPAEIGKYGTKATQVSKVPPRARVLGPDDFRNRIQLPVRYSLMKKAIDKEGKLNGRLLLNELRKLGLDAVESTTSAMPDLHLSPFLQETFGKDLTTELYKLGRTLEHVSAGTGGDTIWVKFAQVGAITALAYGGARERTGIETPITVLLAPVALAYMLTNPALARSLTDGLIHSGGARTGSRAVVTGLRLNEDAKNFVRELPANAVEYYNDWQRVDPQLKDEKEMADAKTQADRELVTPPIMPVFPAW